MVTYLNSFRSIIFMKDLLIDLFGTLTYLAPGEDFGLAIAEILGISKERYLDYTKSWFRKELTAEEFADMMIRDLGTNTDKREIVKWIRNPLSRARLYPEVTESLSRLKRKKVLYLVSDTSSLGREIINNLGLESYFSKLFLSCEYGKTKKEGLYEIVFKEIKKDPKECTVVGDSLEADFNIPLKLGANTILLDRENKFSNYKRISSLRELK